MRNHRGRNQLDTRGTRLSDVPFLQRITIAARVLYQFLGLLRCPIIAGSAMSLSSFSWIVMVYGVPIATLTAQESKSNSHASPTPAKEERLLAPAKVDVNPFSETGNEKRANVPSAS